MSTVNFNMRLNQQLKEQSFAIIESYGLTPAQAFRMFLNQIVDTNAIPLSLNHKQNMQPNAATQEALKEAIDERRHPVRYRDLDSMMTDVLGK